MEELTKLLENINGSYEDFVGAIIHYAKNDDKRCNILKEYIIENPSVTSSDVLRFMFYQPDFQKNMTKQKMKRVG